MYNIKFLEEHIENLTWHQAKSSQDIITLTDKKKDKIINRNSSNKKSFIDEKHY